MRNETVNKVVTLAVIAAFSLGLLFLAGWGIWELMLLVPPNAARLWALAATALLPVTSWATWRLALRYAAGLEHGIDKGIDKVARAGAEAANLRVHVHHALRQQPEPPQVILPQVEIVPRRQLTGGNVVKLA